MRRPFFRKPSTRAMSSGPTFRTDTRGALSLEFAIVLPFLAGTLITVFAYSHALLTTTQMTRVSFVINDIASRYGVVDNTDMAYLFDLQQKMLPVTAREHQMRITSVCYNEADDEYKVLWSYTVSDDDTLDLPQLETDDIPLSLMPTLPDQTSVLITEIRARRGDTFNIWDSDDEPWGNVLVTPPRFRPIVPHLDLNTSEECAPAVSS